MALKEIQKKVDDWVGQYSEGYWQPLSIIARLAEETGELAREVNHIYGQKKKKPSEETNEMGDEIADVIYTLCCLANSQKIDLDEAFEKLMKKLESRDKDRFKKK